MSPNKAELEEIAVVIFQNGKNSSNAKNLHNRLKVWMGILLGCMHHIPSSNSSHYINIDQTLLLYCISSRIGINLPSIIFKYMRKLVKNTRDNDAKIKKLIHMGGLISGVLIESKLVETLQNLDLTK